MVSKTSRARALCHLCGCPWARAITAPAPRSPWCAAVCIPRKSAYPMYQGYTLYAILVLGWRPKHQYPCHHGPEKVFLDTWNGCVWNGQCKRLQGFSGPALLAYIPLHTVGQKMRFWIRGMGVFGMDNAKKLFGFRGGAPNTHISAHHGPEKVFLDTWDGGV